MRPVDGRIQEHLDLAAGRGSAEGDDLLVPRLAMACQWNTGPRAARAVILIQGAEKRSERHRAPVALYRNAGEPPRYGASRWRDAADSHSATRRAPGSARGAAPAPTRHGADAPPAPRGQARISCCNLKAFRSSCWSVGQQRAR